MQAFESDQFDDHERVVYAADRATGLRAIIAIHDTRRGPAIGGCRAWTYPDTAAALHDALRLSRGMTYKAAVADVPFGGGKTVMVIDPARGKPPAMMRALGAAIDDLHGKYMTGEDVGTTEQDMAILKEVTPHVLGAPADRGGSGDPSASTALGCLYGISSAAGERLGASDLRGVRVAVQGLGNVGWRLCELLHREAAILHVCDVRSEVVDRARERFDATPVDVAAIFAADCDVLAPCALGSVIDDRTVEALRVKIVAGAANNQLEHPRHAQALADRGILYAPDYVINAGGMIQLVQEKTGTSGPVEERLRGIGQTLAGIFREARQAGITTAAAADALARRRLAAT